MVDPPRIRPPCALRLIAFWIASVSKPLWLQNFPSSAAITARTILGDMSLKLVQSLVMPFSSRIMVTVTGGGTIA